MLEWRVYCCIKQVIVHKVELAFVLEPYRCWIWLKVLLWNIYRFEIPLEIESVAVEAIIVFDGGQGNEQDR